MKENSKEVLLEFNLPDFRKQDVKVKLTKNSLGITAQRKTEKKVQRKGFFHKESSSHVFNYATTLPNVDAKKAKITFTKGVLKIKAPKK